MKKNIIVFCICIVCSAAILSMTSASAEVLDQIVFIKNTDNGASCSSEKQKISGKIHERAGSEPKATIQYPDSKNVVVITGVSNNSQSESLN